MDSLQCDVTIHGFASLKGERLQDIICSDTRDEQATMNSCFLFSVPRARSGDMLLPLSDDDLLYGTFRDRDKEKFDSTYLTMAAQVGTR